MEPTEPVPDLVAHGLGSPAGPLGHRSKPGLFGRLRAYFLAGVLVTAPIAITIYLSVQVINFIDNAVGTLIPARYIPEHYQPYLPIGIPGLGVVLVLVVLTLIGAFTAGYVGRLVIGLGETLVVRTPVVRHVYGALKQIFETILAHQSTAFREVVLLEYPRSGVWAMGFISGPALRQVQALSQHEMVNVFVPASPPTSGVLLFLPRRNLVVLDMAVEDGLKMVVSGGIVMPPDRAPRRPTPTPPPPPLPG
ncbi:DUF502 domain-containing protein [uncultured Gammaproteobacteria bacterium]